MRKSTVLIRIAIGLLLIPAAAAVWLLLHTMDPAREFEVGEASNESRVLIATQGSKYKDALVSEIVDHLALRRAYTKVIDVSHLSGINADGWNAVVILHTWQIGKPQPDAKAFVERIGDPKKLIVVTTSGSGEEKLPAVDAISSASSIEDMKAQASQVEARLDAALATR